MKIGIISDTHNYLSPEIFKIFKSVDLILHAGDIGDFNILKKLETIAPLKAVYGNTDIYSIASNIPSKIRMSVEGFEILMMHNIGDIKHFVWKLKRGDFEIFPDIVVFGHTHQPFFQKIGEIYFINPGSGGLPKKEHPPTAMILILRAGQLLSHELIKLKVGEL
jgi:putative phosphoesterase